MIKSNLSFFFFMILTFATYLRSLLLTQGHKGFFCFILELLHFCIVHLSQWYILSFYIQFKKIWGFLSLFLFCIRMSNCSSTIFWFPDSMCSLGSLLTVYFIFIISFRNFISYLHWLRTKFWTLVIKCLNDLRRKREGREGNKKQNKKLFENLWAAGPGMPPGWESTNLS